MWVGGRGGVNAGGSWGGGVWERGVKRGGKPGGGVQVVVGRDGVGGNHACG